MARPISRTRTYPTIGIPPMLERTAEPHDNDSGEILGPLTTACNIEQ